MQLHAFIIVPPAAAVLILTMALAHGEQAAAATPERADRVWVGPMPFKGPRTLRGAISGRLPALLSAVALPAQLSRRGPSRVT